MGVASDFGKKIPRSGPAPLPVTASDRRSAPCVRKTSERQGNHVSRWTLLAYSSAGDNSGYRVPSDRRRARGGRRLSLSLMMANGVTEPGDTPSVSSIIPALAKLSRPHPCVWCSRFRSATELSSAARRKRRPTLSPSSRFLVLAPGIRPRGAFECSSANAAPCSRLPRVRRCGCGSGCVEPREPILRRGMGLGAGWDGCTVVSFRCLIRVWRLGPTVGRTQSPLAMSPDLAL